jgi:hypothetical protein
LVAGQVTVNRATQEAPFGASGGAFLRRAYRRAAGGCGTAVLPVGIAARQGRKRWIRRPKVKINFVAKPTRFRARVFPTKIPQKSCLEIMQLPTRPPVGGSGPFSRQRFRCSHWRETGGSKRPLGADWRVRLWAEG